MPWASKIFSNNFKQLEANVELIIYSKASISSNFFTAEQYSGQSKTREFQGSRILSTARSSRGCRPSQLQIVTPSTKPEHNFQPESIRLLTLLFSSTINIKRAESPHSSALCCSLFLCVSSVEQTAQNWYDSFFCPQSIRILRS